MGKEDHRRPYPRAPTDEEWSALFSMIARRGHTQRLFSKQESFLDTDAFFGWQFARHLDAQGVDSLRVHGIELPQDDVVLTFGFGRRDADDIAVSEAESMEQARARLTG